MKLEDAKILITGGARGIGHSLVAHFLEKASQLFIFDKNEELLKNLPDHTKLVKILCDLTDGNSVERSVTDVFQNHGGVNVLINNAGIIHNELVINMLSRPDRKHSFDNWKKVIDINLNAVFLVTSNVVDHMVRTKNHGLIINISSISAQGNAGQSAYSATKAAVEALTKTWAKELSMFKIRSACLAPGFFDTPSTRESLSETMLAKWEKGIPVGRLGTLDELALAAEFLIRNDYYNGKILSLDGGLTI